MTYTNGQITDTGLAFVQINGERIDAKGSFTYKLSGYRREPIDSTNRLAGHKMTYQSGFVEFTAIDNADLDVAKLQGLKGATITLELHSGKIIVCHNATQIDEGEISGDEGELTLKFSGEPVEEA